MKINWILVGAIIGLVIAIVGAVLGWAVFPPLVHEQINEQVILREGTEQWDRWETIPQALEFKVYIFNVTNVEEIQAGAKPILNQVGPYVYKQRRAKTVSKISDDLNTIEYTQQQTFEFDLLGSAPLTQSDRIVVLNMALNSILHTAEETQDSMLSNLNSILPRVFGQTTLESMFMTLTVGEFLFDGQHFCIDAAGAALEICRLVREQGTTTVHLQDDGSVKFALFRHKNVTHDGVYEVYSGVENVSKLTHIIKHDNQEVLTVWNKANDADVCNQINGTDSSSYPPHQEASGSLHIFNADICRSVQLHYEREQEYAGVTGYRFTTGDDFLHEIGPEYGNEGFCVNQIFKGVVKENGCLYKGAIDMSPCLRAPVVVTLPHMLGADEIYTSTVEGLNPDESKHKIFVNMEPHTGYPLEGRKRIQFNMFLRPIKNIVLTQNLATSLLPIMWVEEGIALNDEMIDMINTKLLDVLVILDVVHYVLFAVGLAMFVVFLAWYFIRRNSNKSSGDLQS